MLDFAFEPIKKSKRVKFDWQLAWNPEFDELDSHILSTSGPFESRGHGLTCSGYHRADIPALKRAVRTLQVPFFDLSKHERKKWWAAQVKHYGLVCDSWDVETCRKVLSEALEGGMHGVPDYIQNLERQLNADVRSKQEMEDGSLWGLRREQYAAAATDEQRAVIDPGRFLTERDGQVAVLRNVRGTSHEWHHLRYMARHLNLVVGNLLAAQAVLVIGKRDDVVAEKIRIRQEIAGEKEKRERLAKEAVKAAQKARHENVVRMGGGDDISGQWYLEIPELDVWKTERGTFDNDGHEMEIAAHQPGSDFFFGEFRLEGRPGWLRIYLPDGPVLNNVEMEFGWQIEYERYGEYERGDEVRHEIPNRGVITFDSPCTCFGSFGGWIGGPFSFRGFKENVETWVDWKKCEVEYWNWRRCEYKWRRSWRYDLTGYESVSGHYSDDPCDQCCC